ncbi:MAG: hypothetical protein ACSLFQ_12940 [Thermoanaerobaculia bacterium]
MSEEILKLLDQVRRDIASQIETGINGLRTQVSGLQDEVAGARREALTHFDSLYVRFDRLENEYQALVAAVARLEARSLNRADFDRELDELKSRVQQLEQRLQELERSARQN